jgi:nicotinamidase-related amidase
LRDALILVDVINDFLHEDGAELLESFKDRHADLVQAVSAARDELPVVYANDTRGRWDGDAPSFVSDAIENGLAGDLIRAVAPKPGDSFIFKPRYSAFDSTPLALLLAEMRIERLLLAGTATEMCVTQTAIAARELGFKVTVLADACSSACPQDERIALDYLDRVVGARIHRGGLERAPVKGENDEERRLHPSTQGGSSVADATREASEVDRSASPFWDPRPLRRARPRTQRRGL